MLFLILLAAVDVPDIPAPPMCSTMPMLTEVCRYDPKNSFEGMMGCPKGYYRTQGTIYPQCRDWPPTPPFPSPTAP